MKTGSFHTQHSFIRQPFIQSSEIPSTVVFNRSLIATGAFDGFIRFWVVESHKRHYGGTPSSKLQGHNNNVNCLCFNADGSKLFSGDGSGLIKVWDCVNDKEDDPTKVQYSCIKTLDTLQVSDHDNVRGNRF